MVIEAMGERRGPRDEAGGIAVQSYLQITRDGLNSLPHGCLRSLPPSRDIKIDALGKIHLVPACHVAAQHE